MDGSRARPLNTKPSPRRLGRDPRTGRDLLHLRIDRSEELPDPLELPSPHFVLLLVWDADGVPSPAIDALASRLLDAGCVYACAWGSGCELVHDVFDECIVGDGSAAPDETPLVMTTWHAKEPLDDALWFALNLTKPDDDLSEGCASLLVLEIGEPGQRTRTITEALTDPRGFSSKCVDDAP